MQGEIQEKVTGADRRRYRRIPMSMRAIFRGGVLEAKPCVIRDFCPDGFFIGWHDEKSRSEILAIQDSLPDESFSVEFVVKYKKSGDKTYRVDFKVIRVFQSGMGVSFENPDQKILDILVKIAEVAEKKKQAEIGKLEVTKRSKDQKTTFNKSAPGTLSLEQNLDEILRLYFINLDNKLQGLFIVTVDETEKFEYFTAHDAFENDLDIPRTEILQAIKGQFENTPALKWEKTFEDDETVGSDSLSLVDENEFETYLVLTGIISDAEADNRLLLYRVTKKLSAENNSNYDEGLNPIGFSRLFRTIDSYLQNKRFGSPALKVAYRQMEENIAPELIRLYEEFTEGMEETPENNKRNQFRNNQTGSNSASLNDKVENIQEHTFQQTMFNIAEHGVFPSLQANQSLHMNQNADVLSHTLMALKQSVGVPNTSHEMFQGQVDLNTTICLANQQQQIIQFLDQIQQEDNLNWKNGDTIGDVTGRLNPLFVNAQQSLGSEAQNVIGLAGGVLNFLKNEQALSHVAKQDLQRMQTVLYKQAVSGGGLFQDRTNPLRHIINLFEKLDQRGGNNKPEIRSELDEIVGKILSLDNYDTGSLGNITNDLNSLLEQQNNVYEERVQSVIEQCEYEQGLIKDFKKPESESDQKRSKVPTPTGEYQVWQNYAKSMKRGDSVVIKDHNGDKKSLSLAWMGADQNQFVFVDGEGNKEATMTQQELVVRLLKGTAELTDKDQKPLFDRALLSSLFDAYDDVNKQIINDQETGLLNEDKYRTELNLILKNAERDHVEHVFFYLSLSVDESTEKDNVIYYLKHTSELALDVFGEQSLIGRVGDNSIGITSEFMSREGALILAETLLKSLEDNLCDRDGSKIAFPLSIGITVINDHVSDIDEVILQAFKASNKAKEQGDNQAWVHEETSSNDDQKSEVEHETIDWQFWLEDYSQKDAITPIFGRKIILSGNKKGKPLFHIFPAVEDDEGVIRKPARFIKACSDHDLVCNFEKQFIHSCLQWMVKNKKQISSNVRCLINLSGKTINKKGTLDFIIEELSQCAVPPGKICFEIPGSPLENEKANIDRFIRTLSEIGCRFSLGQFGLDGLSQEALKLPADYICIDEILTSDVVESAQSYGLIKSLNDIAHMMEKQTIVPKEVGEETLELLTEMNIDYITETGTEKSVHLNSVFEEFI